MAAAIGGALFVITGYGTGLGITTLADPTIAIAKPPVASTSPAQTMPSEPLPTIAAPVVAQAPASAPILTAPTPTFSPPVVSVPAPSTPVPSTASCASPMTPSGGGGLLSLDLTGTAAPLLRILDGLPVVGSLLTTPVLANGACRPAPTCCPVDARTAVR